MFPSLKECFRRNHAATLIVAMLALAWAGIGMAADTRTETVILNDQAPYFQPKRLKVARGTTVTWENRGPGLIHTVVVATTEGMRSSGPIPPGTKWSHTFAEDAVVKASCEIHPYMYGIVIVGDPPAELIATTESQMPSTASPGIVIDIVEFPIPVPNSVPGILFPDAQDNIWVTLGGGGWGNIAHPPLSKFARLTADGDLSIYDTQTPGSGPSGVRVGKDGRVYLTLLMAGRIARFDPTTKTIEEFRIPTDTSWPTGLELATDGAVWFNETKGNKVGRLSVDGIITEYAVPTVDGRPTGIALDSRGDVWIAERDGSKIAQLRKDGSFIEYPLPTPRAKPAGILVDRQDRVWFAQREANKIGVIENGALREYPLPNPKSGPFYLVEDQSGLIWFSETFGNRIGVLNPADGRIVEFALPTPDSWPGGLAFDSQGALWFTEQLGNKVAMIANPTEAARKAFAAQTSANANSNAHPAPPQHQGVGAHSGHDRPTH
ncbi:virginiamycin B lyase family protein [Lysobacter hankyongensis]|uniref:Virginiamycin B lyase n=1 Tax=Lysobacter hankyongensis TaxID=1176535 RepID=A0ABP9B7I5_9GAMM